MTNERSGLVKFRGHDVSIIGDDLHPGDVAPEFHVQNQDWETFQGLAGTNGKVRIIASLPSLDTEVCDRETRRFNMEATKLSEDISILVISMDLPYVLKRYCGAAGINQVLTLSDHLDADFGRKYGCLIKEVRVFRRAVFVISRTNIITYAAYMPTLGTEPEYSEVLSAAVSALK